MAYVDLTKGRYSENGRAYFITTVLAERERRYFDDFYCARLVVDEMRGSHECGAVHSLAWVVMPDHVHLLVQDPDLVEFVRLLKGRMTPPARRYEQGRRLWQRSFHDHGLRRDESLERVALYIFENPVRSGLVGNAEDYPWSGSNVWPDWRSCYDAVGGRG